MIIAVDFASVDRNIRPSYSQMATFCQQYGSSLRMAIFRGAYGTMPDATVQDEWRRAQDAGLITGAYLFLRMKPEQPAIDQVHAFANTVRTLTARDLPPVVDVEDAGYPAEKELAVVHEAWTAMRDIYGVPPMIYTSARVWAEDLHNLPAGEMVDSPLWLAKPWPWQVRSPAMVNPVPFQNGDYDPKVPPPWGSGNWWLHQYQGDAKPTPGFSSTVDLSRMRTMSYGEVGPRVGWIQRRLGMPITNIYDSTMGSRLKDFQTSKGLVADGVIGPLTFTQIAWTKPAVPTTVG